MIGIFEEADGARLFESVTLVEKTGELKPTAVLVVRKGKRRFARLIGVSAPTQAAGGAIATTTSVIA